MYSTPGGSRIFLEATLEGPEQVLMLCSKNRAPQPQCSPLTAWQGVEGRGGCQATAKLLGLPCRCFEACVPT
eukprot:1140019-Pelagomonas_calceolata.AAC.1